MTPPPPNTFPSHVWIQHCACLLDFSPVSWAWLRAVGAIGSCCCQSNSVRTRGRAWPMLIWMHTSWLQTMPSLVAHQQPACQKGALG